MPKLIQFFYSFYNIMILCLLEAKEKMIIIKTFSEEDKEIVFEDERGIEHRLSFDDVDSLVRKLVQMHYLELAIRFARKWKL